MDEIQMLNGESLLVQVFPKKDYWLWPLLYRGAIGLIVARSGIGKSYLSLWMGAAAASGGKFLEWYSQTPIPTLIIEGEMGTEEQQARLDIIVEADCFDKNLITKNLHFITCDRCKSGVVPDIASASGQAMYDKKINEAGIKIIFIDNLLTTMRIGPRESEVQAWARVQPWLIKHRNEGRCIVPIHHAGKNATQLGSSTKEILANWVMYLTRPVDYEQSQGARFEIHFHKNRDLLEEFADPVTVQYSSKKNEKPWRWEKLRDYFRNQVFQMKDIGMKDSQIAEATGHSLYAVKQVLANRDLFNQPSGEEYVIE